MIMIGSTREGRPQRRRAAVVAAACLVAACAEYLGTSFSEIAPPEIAGRDVRPGARCLLEAVNAGEPGGPWRASPQHRVHFHGWAIDGATLSSSDWLVVRLTKVGGGGRYYAVTWARAPREDVARELGAAAGIARSGFDIIGTVQRVPPGTYDIDLVIGAPAGPVSCATGSQLVAV
jgi:hypothetical protein